MIESPRSPDKVGHRKAAEVIKPAAKGLWGWVVAQVHKLHAITDTPHAIALGFALGVFFGFLPLFGLKTLLAILFAWLLRSSKLAAVIGVTLHDLLLPFIPLLLRLEYQLGYWLLSHPHRLPPKLAIRHIHWREFLDWTNMLKTGGPIMLGSVIIGLVFAVPGYFMLRGAVRSYRKHKAHLAQVDVAP